MFKQKRDPAPDKPRLEPADAVQQARTRARQRLIGAIVLLGDRHHRLSARLRDAAAADSGRRADRDPAPRCAAAAGDAAGACADAAGASDVTGNAPAAPTSAPAAATRRADAGARSGDGVITESSADAGREVIRPRVRRRPSAPHRDPSRRPPAAEPPRRAASTAVASRRGGADSGRRAARRADGERARALLEGRPVASAEEQRFVVQVGAFADAEAARETRKNVEKLGLKTYTQVAQTSAGSRIRVRVGPFASRGEAEAALAKAKAAGLNAVLLTL